MPHHFLLQSILQKRFLILRQNQQIVVKCVEHIMIHLLVSSSPTTTPAPFSVPLVSSTILELCETKPIGGDHYTTPLPRHLRHKINIFAPGDLITWFGMRKPMFEKGFEKSKNLPSKVGLLRRDSTSRPPAAKFEQEPRFILFTTSTKTTTDYVHEGFLQNGGQSSGSRPPCTTVPNVCNAAPVIHRCVQVLGTKKGSEKSKISP